MTPNMEHNERFNFGAVGVVVLFGGMLNFHHYFWVVLGVFLIAQGAMSWCCIPWLRDYFNKKTGGGTNS